MTTPLSTAWPKSAMKPMAAETLSGMPESNSAKMPPIRPNGTFTRISSALLTDLKAFHRPLLVLKLPAPGHKPTLRQGNFSDALLHVGHDAAHVASFDKNADSGQARAVLAADIHTAAGFLERGDLFEGDVETVRSVHEDFFEVGQAALAFGQAHDDAEVFLAFPQLRRRFARQSDFDHILDVANVQAVAGGAIPVNLDEGLRHFANSIIHRRQDAAH